ncbi:MAG: restriction endonuclease subunit S [Chloroflexi bacterium]|nr:restriction endonuclease subunit S [Chloroflexota bacterium]
MRAELQCFAVRRGKVIERIDPKFIYHGGHNKLGTGNEEKLGNLVVQEPDYGAAEKAVAMSSSNDVRYIRITDFDDEGIPEGHEFVTAENVDDRFLLEDGDVLFARSGATVGKTFIYTKEIGKSIFAGYCIRFRFDKEKALPGFVYYYTKTERYKTWVRSMQRPAGQPNINKEEFKTFEIPIPLLDIQRALVAEMEAARKARAEKLSQAEGLLQGMDAFVLEQLGLKLPKEEKRATFAIRFDTVQDGRVDPHFHHPIFSKLIDVIQKTSCKELGQLVKFSDEIWSPEQEPAETFRYIEISGIDIPTGNISAVETLVSEAPSRARMAIRDGDILVSLTRPHRGAIAQADKSLDGCVASTGFSVIREITEKRISKDYLWSVLRNQICLQQMLQRSSGGNYPAITEPELEKILIPIPSEKIQERISSELSRRRAQARALREEAEREWQNAKEKFEKALLG